MNYSILNFRSTNTVDRLGIARALMKNVVSEYYITHYSSKDKITERTEFADAEQCYDAFQKLCFSYEEATHKDQLISQTKNGMRLMKSQQVTETYW